MAIDFSQFIGDDPLNEELLRALAVALDKTAAPASALEPVNTGQFREQAESEASPYFTKDLDLAMREIAQVEEARKRQKQLEESQQAENFSEFKNIEDRTFARALGAAQGRFSGQGLGTSGIRNKAIGEGITDQEQVISDAERQDRQSTAQRNLSFEDFLKGTELQRERTTLNIDRAREGEVLARQSQLAAQEQGRRSAITEQSDRDFNRVIGFSSFLNDKLNA